MRWMSLQSTDDVVIGTEVGQSQDTVQCILYNSIEAELCFLASFLHA